MQPDNKNNQLTTDDRADVLFKKSNYDIVYIVVNVTGVPENCTLRLVDENLQQLYSPYNINAESIKTACTITSHQYDAIQLPANYSSNGTYTDFSADTYNWNLKFDGNTYWEESIIPFTVEIRDFKVWDILNPSVYPNEDINVRVRSYLDTIMTASTFGNDYKNNYPNSYYNESTGIITYVNQDINTNIGTHTQVINQLKNYVLNYEVLSPVEFYTTHQGNYKPNNNSISNFTIGAKIPSDCTMDLYNNTASEDTITITINGETYPFVRYNSTNIKGKFYQYTQFPPDTYDCTVRIRLNDGKYYTCTGSFDVSTKNCAIDLEYIVNNDNTYTLIATYTYNSTVPIPNATVGLINVQTNTLMDISTTNSNGEYQFNVNAGVYKVVAINSYNQYIVESNIVDFINIYDVLTDLSIIHDGNDLLINNISSINLNTYKLKTNIYMGDNNNLFLTSLSLLDINKNNQVLINVERRGENIIKERTALSNISDDDEIVQHVVLNDNENIEVETISASNINNITVIIDIDIDANGDIIVTKEKYININSIDEVVSQIAIDDGDLKIKTIGDIKAELYD